MSDGAFLHLRQTATPNGNAQNGGVLFYFKTDGKAYTKINGVEALLADVTQSGTQTLTNKTIALGSNTISGTTAQFNAALTDNDFATLAGSETLTNKTVNLSSNTLSGTTAQFNTALSDNDFATLAGTETLTNKTLSTGTKVGAATTDISAALASYTPTATNFTVGNGTLTGKYMQVGKMVFIRVNFVAGTTSTYTTSQMQISIPVTSHASGNPTVPARLYFTAGQFASTVTINPSASVMALETPTSTANCGLVAMSSTSPNPGTTGQMVVEGWYEAA